jgi:hypothetical protein
MYAVIINPFSYRCVEDGWPLNAGEQLMDVLPVVPPTLTEIAAQITLAVQSWLDQTVQANGYDDINSCVSYASSAVAQWAADAAAAMAWRDAVWQACFALQQSIMANPPTVTPTAAQIISELPQAATYDWVAHAPGA